MHAVAYFAALSYAAGYALVAATTAFFFLRNIKYHTAFDWVLVAGTALLAAGIGFGPRRLLPVFTAVLAGLLVIDPNLTWNTNLWWRWNLSPLLFLVITIMSPALIIRFGSELRSLLFSHKFLWGLLALTGLALVRLAMHLVTPTEASPDRFWWAYPNQRLMIDVVVLHISMVMLAIGLIVARLPESQRRFCVTLFVLTPLVLAIFLWSYITKENAMYVGGSFYRLWGFRVNALYLSFKLVCIFFLWLGLSATQTRQGSHLLGSLGWIVLLALTLSRSSIASLAVGMLVLLFLDRTKVKATATLAGLVLTTGLLTTACASLLHQENYFARYTETLTPRQEAFFEPEYSRNSLYSWGSAQFIQHPILGLGAKWPFQYVEKAELDLPTLAKIDSLRNYYLDLGVAGGILPPFAFCALMAGALSLFFTARFSQAVAYTGAGLFGLIFYSQLLEPAAAGLFYLGLGILITIASSSNREGQSSISPHRRS